MPKREKGLLKLPDGQWRASWWLEGRWIRRTFPTHTQAKEARSKAIGDIVENRYHDRRKEVLKPFEEGCKEFTKWSSTNTSESTAQQDEYLVRRWQASPHLGGKMLSRITVMDIEAYKAERVVKVSPRMTDYDLSRLRKLFNVCKAYGFCESNPLEGIKFFNPKGRKERYLTVDEERGLLESMDSRIRPILFFGIQTGLRIGELLALTWAQVDFKVGKYGQVTVRGEIAKDREDRHVPLSQTARGVLDAFPHPIKKDTPVFSTFGGRINLYKLWYQGIRASRLNGDEENIVPRAQRVTVHTLRHTFASRLVMAGVDLGTVQKLMGHSSITTTMRYAHLAPSHVQDSVLVLDAHYQKTNNAPQEGAGQTTP